MKAAEDGGLHLRFMPVVGVRMKKLILYTLTALALLAITGLGAALLWLKKEWTPETLEGWDAVGPYIQTDGELRAQWAEFQADTLEHEVLTAKAVKPMLQAGTGFYVKCRYDPADLPDLVSRWGKEGSPPGTWKEQVFGLRYNGIRYSFWTSSADGPESHAVVDSEEAGIVHYSGYAGDG